MIVIVLIIVLTVMTVKAATIVIMLIPGRPASKNAPLAVEICKMLRARGLSTTAKSDRTGHITRPEGLEGVSGLCRQSSPIGLLGIT